MRAYLNLHLYWTHAETLSSCSGFCRSLFQDLDHLQIPHLVELISCGISNKCSLPDFVSKSVKLRGDFFGLEVLNWLNSFRPFSSLSSSRLSLSRSSVEETDSAAIFLILLSSMLLTVWLVKMRPSGSRRQFSIAKIATLLMKVVIAI